MSITSIKVAFFLATRQLRRASLWTTTLIILVMTLTFLNLVVVSGVLVGLVQSSSIAQKERYTGDIIISTLREKTYIQRSAEIERIAKGIPGFKALSARYIEPGKIESDYKNRTRQDDKLDSASGLVTGIDPIAENTVTGISKYVIEGSFLQPNDYDQIVIGANLLYKYAAIDSPGQSNLKTAQLGSKVRLKIGDISREVTIKGIIKSKVDVLDLGIYMTANQLRALIGRNDYNVDEIAITFLPGTNLDIAKQYFTAAGVEEVAKVQTSTEAEPKFLKDIVATFAILGNLIGSIGLAVASITIFIVIFVNAITRRKFIGILKGIGINSWSIELSYVFQSIFYAGIGTSIGMVILYGFLKPYVDAHPINFPFSDGIIYVPIDGTLVRVFILLVITVIAGYLPARMIVKRNTLDSILGR